MIAKRALIVDDSRSARVILSRMLEAYGLEVDAAESAEQALEYLRQARPDVIFMDHLMPGMDGFQAVQAIKGNPDTAMIPVMMYTSQEGDLYVSQARALGAFGVLPKTVKQGEVSRVLYQLHLLPERRESRAAPAAANQEVIEPMGHRVQIERPPVAVGEIETAVRQAIAPALKELNSELRRFMLAGFEAFAKRLTAEIKSAASGTSVVQQEPVEIPAAPEPMRLRWPLLAAACAVALIPTVVLGVLYVRTLGSSNGLMKSNAHLTSVIADQQTQLRSMQDALRNAANNTAAGGGAAAAASQDIAPEAVPYGEAPLSGARLERLRSLVDDLIAAGFRGKVKVAAYVGEFCLTGNGIEGYSMAADDLPAKRCDLVGNPFDDNLPNAQRQSLQFANLLAGVRQRMADALTIEVAYVGRRPKVPYPDGELLTKTTAGEWNRIAAQNNRVEFVMEAALADSSG